MQRRAFLKRLGTAVAGVAASPFAGGRDAHAAVVFADTFRRRATSKGWGKPWFNQRYRMKWGISKRRGTFTVPAPQPGAGDYNPHPVLALNREVLDTDVTALVSSSQATGRRGVIARMASYGNFYAAWLDGSRLLLSRCGLSREGDPDVNLPRSVAFATKAGTAYWVRLKVTGTSPVRLRAKAWPAGRKEPATWNLSASDDHARHRLDKPGTAGLMFMHDAATRRATTFKVARFKLASPAEPEPTPPRVTFAFAGRVVPGSDGNLRARLVAKTDVPADVVFHVGPDPRLRRSSRTVVEPDEKHGRLAVAKGWINGMAPGETFYWRAEARTKAGARRRSPVRTLRTPPKRGQGATFAFGSCTHFFPVSRSFSEAVKHSPYFFAHLGDFGYPQGDDNAATALRSDLFQDRWTRMLARGTLAQLHEQAMWIGLQDDHDYGSDNAWSETVRGFTISAFDQISGNLGDRFFDLRLGDLHCFFLDNHINADDPQATDGPSHTMIGEQKKQWLKDAMRGSDADLLVVFSGMPFWGLGDGSLGWKRAFETERRELISFFDSLQGPSRRVLICSGNAHAHYINRFPNANGKGIIEFVSSGTDRIDSGTAQPVTNADPVIDPDRAIRKVDAFGLVSLQPAGNVRKVILRVIESKTGQDLWPRLELDL